MNKIKLWSRVTPRCKAGVYLASSPSRGKSAGVFKGTGVVLEIVSVPINLGTGIANYQVCLITNNTVTGWVGYSALDVVEVECND